MSEAEVATSRPRQEDLAGPQHPQQGPRPRPRPRRPCARAAVSVGTALQQHTLVDVTLFDNYFHISSENIIL